MGTRRSNHVTSNIRFLTEEENSELFIRINADNSKYSLRNRAIFHLAKYCALRASEVGLITLNDYNPLTGTVHCHRLKGSKDNTLKIVDPYILSIMNQYYYSTLRQALALKAFCKGKDKYLFISQKGGPISRKMLDAIMKKYCSRTAIPYDKHHFHVLKHTRAMELIDYPEFKLNDVQWWLGHKNISNTMLYLEFTAGAMKHLFEALSLHENKEYENYAHKKTEANNYSGTRNL